MPQFTICRTSASYGMECPFPGATLEAEDSIRGRVWMIDIPDLDALIALVKRVQKADGSDIIISEDHLEIYDDYRE